MDTVYDIIAQGLMITGFVVIMMMVIEYLNVLTGGRWDAAIARRKSGQLWFCSFLGATPGCLGAYAVGSFYIHRVIGLGALTAAMFATCGDESFVMLALYPRTALLIFGTLFIGGIITGALVDLFKQRSGAETGAEITPIHRSSHPEDPVCIPFSATGFVAQWRNCSPQRGWLTFFLVIFLGGILSGRIMHEHHSDAGASGGVVASVTKMQSVESASPATENHVEQHHQQESLNWIKIIFVILTITALAIVATVPDHFLDDHLWRHIIKVHAWRIMLWTVGALAVTHIMLGYLNISEIVADHRLPLLLTACLIGIFPISGPHLVFVMLYFQQALPLSILAANCIVQDGHGMLPTLAHSRRTFVYVKSIKFVIGMSVGIVGHLTGW